MNLSRRELLVCIPLSFASLALYLEAQETVSGPWSTSELLEPSALAKQLESKQEVHIFCVGFPVLYRKKHIAHAQLAGPASKPEGLNTFNSAVASLPKETQIVIYCGCCPMKDCPNVRPAYAALKAAGFQNIRVLNLPKNLRVDWLDKGYPVEA